MEQSRKKELIAAYKQRTPTGGVYAIACPPAGKVLIKGDFDLQGAENRFRFAVSTDSCVVPALKEDWKQFGGKSFEFSILEEIKQAEEQSNLDFRRDIQTLEELWKEKYSPGQLY